MRNDTSPFTVRENNATYLYTNSIFFNPFKQVM